MSNLKAGATADRSRDNSQLILDFDDNLLLSELFGAHDTNLVRIEETLGISIVSRGNKVFLSGNQTACQRAGEVLEQLYSRLKAGDRISKGDVDGALRMTVAPLKVKKTNHTSKTAKDRVGKI